MLGHTSLMPLQPLQNDSRSIPAGFYCNFDNRSYPSIEDPDSIVVYTDLDKYTVPRAGTVKATGIWGLPGWFTPSRKSDGTYLSVNAEGNVWRALHRTNGDPLGAHLAACLRMDNLNVGEGILILINYKFLEINLAPANATVVQFSWQTATNTDIGTLRLNFLTTGYCQCQIIDRAGTVLSFSISGTGMSVGNTGYYVIMLEKVSDTSVYVNRWFNGASISRGTWSSIAGGLPGTGDTPTSTATGAGLCIAGRTGDSLKTNVYSTADYMRHSIRSIGMFRVSNSIVSAIPTIGTAYMDLKGNIPLASIRGYGV